MLPGTRSDRVAEEGVVVTPPQPVGPPVLLVGPPGGQIPRRGDLVVDDRPLTQRGADRRIAPSSQSLKQLVQGVALDDLHSVWRA